MHKNQEKILEYLQGSPQGETMEHIAEHLGVTKNAAREHVLKIEQKGLIRYRDVNTGIGRPSRHYVLTDEGKEVFPKQYLWLTNSILGLLNKDLGEKQVADLMKKLGETVASDLEERLSRHTSTPDRIRELSAIMNELGYRSIVKQSDIRKGAILEAFNCVYHGVAQEYPSLCEFDISLIKNATKLDVDLMCCVAKGGASCQFKLTK